MKKLTFFLIAVFLTNFFSVVSVRGQERFGKIELLVQNGDRLNEKTVVVSLNEDSITIDAKDNSFDKTFKYSDIKAAEYSYSKSPRWKTGVGLAAASLLFPPLLFIALPVGFSKHRRHWLSIRTGDDYAVLKLSKSNRKIFIPAFETKSGVTVTAEGEDK